jgi:hypothetical protein
MGIRQSTASDLQSRQSLLVPLFPMLTRLLIRPFLAFFRGQV